MKLPTRKWMTAIKHWMRDLARRRVTVPLVSLLIPALLFLGLFAAQLCRLTQLQAAVDDIRDRADAIESRVTDLSELPPGSCGEPYDEENEPDPNYLDI